MPGEESRSLASAWTHIPILGRARFNIVQFGTTQFFVRGFGSPFCQSQRSGEDRHSTHLSIMASNGPNPRRIVNLDRAIRLHHV